MKSVIKFFTGTIWKSCTVPLPEEWITCCHLPSFFLGVGVTLNVGSPFILGPGVVGISILKRVFRFGTRSTQADRQSRAWLKLFNTQHRFPSDKTLFLTITSLEQDASKVWSMLIGPAIVMTETALGKTPIESLTAGEKTLCIF